MPFVYDPSDLYKENLCIDLAFALTSATWPGVMTSNAGVRCLSPRVIEMDLLAKLADDIPDVLGK